MPAMQQHPLPVVIRGISGCCWDMATMLPWIPRLQRCCQVGVAAISSSEAGVEGFSELRQGRWGFPCMERASGELTPWSQNWRN